MSTKRSYVFVMRRVMCCLTSVMVVVMLIGFSIGVVQAESCELPNFDDYEFDKPVDNPYFPRAIKRMYVYEAEEDEFILNYIYISKDKERIGGVKCTVIYDVEWIWVEDLGVSGEWRKLEETEDWHAWDNEGNFWYFGVGMRVKLR